MFFKINPVYIYLFFKENSIKGWSVLGGCVLCITVHLFWPAFVIATIAAVIASQALISTSFSCVKQAMALGSTIDMANAYGIAEFGVMIVSTTLVTLVMLLIWQTNLFFAICFPLVFGTIELIYLSVVLSKITEGGWLPLAFASFFLCVMYVWNYGSVLKFRSELRGTIWMKFMLELGASLGASQGLDCCTMSLSKAYRPFLDSVYWIFPLFTLP
ncbi:potassium transporter 12 isoform X2 [Olea europaea subsp. europaea]|uniref:Potassium transporter 12 isoform X2 n=1 Tax=Olea europaea subsp. europaea TaxID=158383 RepID=A0A8S0VBI2_OLEEU|nr:potassium transporter 12 isoform X2 [Olea europaea subsp. europaea]